MAMLEAIGYMLGSVIAVAIMLVPFWLLWLWIGHVQRESQRRDHDEYR